MPYDNSGWASLGSVLGGGKMNQAMAYERGMLLGAQSSALSARTQEAMVEAAQRQNQEAARAKLPGLIQGAMTGDPQAAAQLFATAAQAGINVDQIQQAITGAHNLHLNDTQLDPNMSDDARERALLAAGRNPVRVFEAAGPGEQQNEFHPSRGTTTTPLAQSQIAANTTRAQNPNPQGVALTPDAAAMLSRVLGPNLGYLAARNPALINQLAALGIHAPVAAPPGGAAPGATVTPPGATVTPPATPFVSRHTIMPRPDVPPQQTAFDPQQNQANNKILEGFASSGTNTDGGRTEAANRLAGHLDTLRHIVGDMQNGNVQPSNQFRTWWNTTFRGSPVPTNLQLAGRFVAGEAVKQAAGLNAGTEEERNTFAAAFDGKHSQSQMDQAIDTMNDLGASQVSALEQHYATTGRTDFRERYLSAPTRADYGFPTEAEESSMATGPSGAAAATGAPNAPAAPPAAPPVNPVIAKWAAGNGVSGSAPAAPGTTQ